MLENETRTNSSDLESPKGGPSLGSQGLWIGLCVIIAGAILAVFLKDKKGDDRTHIKLGNWIEFRSSSRFAGTIIFIGGILLMIQSIKSSRPEIQVKEGAVTISAADQNTQAIALAETESETKPRLLMLGAATASKPADKIAVEMEISHSSDISGTLLPDNLEGQVYNSSIPYVRIPKSVVIGAPFSTESNFLFIPSGQREASDVVSRQIQSVLNLFGEKSFRVKKTLFPAAKRSSNFQNR